MIVSYDFFSAYELFSLPSFFFREKILVNLEPNSVLFLIFLKKSIFIH